MQRLISSLFFMIAASSSLVFAQGVVQLPEYQHMDVNTTVMVPDGGSMNTGGITRSSSGGTSSGTPILPFRNRSYGSSNSISSMQTSVQIIDLHEMDEAILNSPSAPSRIRRPGAAFVPEDRFQQRQSEATRPEKTRPKSTHDQIQSRILEKSGKPVSKEKRTKRSEKLRKPLDLSQKD